MTDSNFGIPSPSVRIEDSDEGIVISRHALHRMLDSIRLNSMFSHGEDAIICLGNLELDSSEQLLVVTNVIARLGGVLASAERLTMSTTDDCSIYLNAKPAWSAAATDAPMIELRTSTLSLSDQPSESSLELARVLKRGVALRLDPDFVPQTESTNSDPNGRRITAALSAFAQSSLPIARPILEDRCESWLRVFPVLRMAASLYGAKSLSLGRALDEVLLSDPCYRPAGFLRAFRQHLHGSLPETHKVKVRPAGEVSLQMVRSLQVGNPERANDGFCWPIEGQVNDGEWIVVRFDNLEYGYFTATYTTDGNESIATVANGSPVVVARGRFSAIGKLQLAYQLDIEPTLQIACYSRL